MSAERTRLDAALRPYVLRRRAIAAAAGLLQGIALAALVVTVAIVVGGSGVLDAPEIRLAALVALLTPTAIRSCSRVRPIEAALAIEHAFPFLQDRVATAVEITHGPAGRGACSETLCRRVVAEATEALRDLPLTRALDRRPLIAATIAALASIVLVVTASALIPPRTPETYVPAAAVIAEPTGPPRQPPAILDLAITVAPPEYTGLPERRIEGAAESVRALAGSQVAVTASVIPLDARATVVAEPGGERELTVSDGTISHTLTVSAPLRLRLAAESADGRAQTPWIAIKPMADAPPTLRLTRPERDLTLDVAEPVEVAVSAGDDFGVTALGIRYRLADDARWRSLPMHQQAGEGVATARLNPAGVGLEPGGELLVRAWATDNDAVSGPKTTLSPPVRIRLVMPQRDEPEPTTPVEAAQREEEDAVEALQRAAQQMQQELEAALESAQGGPAGDARQQLGHTLQEAARRLQELAGRLQSAMERAEREMAANERLSPELIEKVRQLHELMREVMDEEMREALRQLQEALRSEDIEQVRVSLEQAREAQERFLERLEQTLELLRRARLEATLERLREISERLAEQQRALIKRTEAMEERSAQTRKGAAEQRDLAADADQLRSQVEAAVEQARELDEQWAARLGAVADQVERDDPGSQMRTAASALDRGSPSDAADPQQRAQEALDRASHSLGQLAEQLKSEMTEDVRRQIAMMIRDSLAISRGQEDLDAEVERLGRLARADLMRGKGPIDPVRRRQSTLAEATAQLASRIRELAGRTPAMDPRLAADAQKVAQQMAQVAREIEGAALTEARHGGRDAMAGLNEIARRLMETQEQLSQQSAQMTLSQWMQQLKSLAQRQQGLNQQTGQRQQGETGQPGSQGAGMTLGQMAYEQQLIRRALEEMLRRGGRGTKPTADQLGGVPEEMEKVEGDLRSGRMRRETVERQERILEKMLEAQRSLYTKQQERSERKAERPGEWEPPPSPPPLSPSLLRAPGVSVERGEAAETLPRGYEDAVRQYFRLLGEEAP